MLLVNKNTKKSVGNLSTDASLEFFGKRKIKYKMRIYNEQSLNDSNLNVYNYNINFIISFKMARLTADSFSLTSSQATEKQRRSNALPYLKP